jgi:3'-phosphoadenosine 5'-phosphosulfate sulfotransferase (PAPS reductase)/FAD synthetase
MEPDVLEPNATAVVSISGGKDSLATALCAIEAYGRQHVRLVMADTGHEHPLTTEYVRDYLPGALGLPVEIVRADFSRDIERKRAYIAEHWPHDGIPADRVRRAVELLMPTGNPFLDLCLWKGRFPSRMAQFCTEQLKRIPLDIAMLRLIRNGSPVESWQGVRRDESRRRADLPAEEWGGEGPGWLIRRPIIDWSAERVVAYVRSHGVRLNPLYYQGMGRVGCMPCINCTKNELHEIAKRWPDEIARVREWEQLVAEVSKRGAATFFADPIGDGPLKEAQDYARIDEVVAWARTSRGGRQFDLLKRMPVDGCTSLYGLCE